MLSAPVPSTAPATLPSPAPWYAQGTTADFSMSELYTFAIVLENLDAFDDVPDVMRYFEKPNGFSGEHARWVELGRPQSITVDQAEYILDAGTKAKNFEEWKTQNASKDDS